MRDDLRAYQYVAPNLSLFERLYLDQFWTRCAEYYPNWLAPNMITFVGFLFASVGLTCLFLGSPGLGGACPPWALRVVAVSIFMYQTMDGSDGKQARRTKSGTPLGELFDHGVDAIVTCFFWCVSTELLAVRMDNASFPLFGVLSQLTFFMSNLVLLHTGRQHYQQMDAQELQFALYSTAMVVSFFGTAATVLTWHIPMPESVVSLWSLGPPILFGEEGVDFNRNHRAPGSIALNRVLLQVGTWGMISSVCFSFANIAMHYVRMGGGVRPITQNGRGIGQLLLQLASMALICAFSILSWVGLVAEGAGPAGMLLYWAMTTLSYGDLVFHVLCTRTAQTPFPLPYQSRGILCLAIFSALTQIHGGGWVIQYLRVGMLAANGGMVMHYAISMGTALCDALNIRFFFIQSDSSKRK